MNDDIMTCTFLHYGIFCVAYDYYADECFVGVENYADEISGYFSRPRNVQLLHIPYEHDLGVRGDFGRNALFLSKKILTFGYPNIILIIVKGARI